LRLLLSEIKFLSELILILAEVFRFRFRVRSADRVAVSMLRSVALLIELCAMVSTGLHELTVAGLSPNPTTSICCGW